MRWLPVVAAALTAAAVGFGAATAVAAPADRASALDAYNKVQQDLQVPAGWTGSTDTCTVGIESPESLAATLNTVNTLRDFASVPPVAFDDGLNHKALAAAMMMLAKGELSHTPDPSWPCYSDDGADGAGHSNLFYGYSGAQAMVGYVEDPGTPSLGHRLWLLEDSLKTMGTGSTGSTNALYVSTDSNQFPRNTVPPNSKTAWPPEGFVPWPWVFPYWSVGIGGSGQTASFEQNSTVTVTANGQQLPVHDVDPFGATLIWVTDVPAALRDADQEMQVTITGAKIDGADFPLSYNIKAFKAEPLTPGPGPGPNPDPQPGADTLAFTSRPVVRRRDGRKRPIRRGTRLKVLAPVTGGSVTRYQWLRSGRTIKGARKVTYRVRKGDRGKRLACRVTAKSPAGAKITRTSRSVRVRR
jgi:uncharacterized protein YkwD